MECASAIVRGPTSTGSARPTIYNQLSAKRPIKLYAARVYIDHSPGRSVSTFQFRSVRIRSGITAATRVLRRSGPLPALQRQERGDDQCSSSDDGCHSADPVSEIDKPTEAGTA